MLRFSFLLFLLIHGFGAFAQDDLLKLLDKKNQKNQKSQKTQESQKTQKADSVAPAQDDLLKLLDAKTQKTDSVAPDDPYVQNTFRTTRLINASTTETLEGRHLDFRVTHRFGNVAGKDNDIDDFFGLDEATNIRIAFEYGINDRLMIGGGRSKINALLDGFLKYRLLRQTTNNKMPVAVTLMGTAGYDSKESPVKKINRLSYNIQAIIARKINEKVSLELIPLFLHRNLVAFDDNNNLFALGAGGRINISKSSAILVDYYHIFSDYRKERDFSPPLGIGYEVNTGGHTFHMNFTNASGIVENQFIADTRDSWLDGHFKWGFNISRIFKF